jgi:hypothetical protein
VLGRHEQETISRKPFYLQSGHMDWFYVHEWDPQHVSQNHFTMRAGWVLLNLVFVVLLIGIDGVGIAE